MRASVAVCLLLSLSSAKRGEAQSAQDNFQRALTLERAQGKLDSAIALYRRVVATAGSNRPLAARALLQLGRAYEVLGKSEARSSYDRIVRDYSDQPDLVTQARARIAAIDAPARAASLATVAPAMREAWVGAGNNPYSLPSPDRRWVTYLDSTGNVAVHNLVSGRNRVLATGARLRTPQGGRDSAAVYADEEMVFSADSKRIAYAWHTDRENSYELRTIGLDENRPRVVPIPKMSYVQSFGWTPGGDAVLALIHDVSGDESLAFVRLTGQVQRVRAYPATSWNFGLSPDGRWIIYDALVGSEQQRDVFIMAADGTRERVLATHAANDWHPMWAPDGRSVIFYSDRSGGWRAWQVDVLDGAARGEPRAVSPDMGWTVPIGFTKDGAFWYSPVANPVVLRSAVLDSTTGRLSEPAREVAVPSMGTSAMPDLSPGGGSLAFIAMRSDAGSRPNALVLQNRDGSDRREMALNIGVMTSPRWSPDGRSILLWGRQPGGDAAFSLDVATGALSTLVAWPVRNGPPARVEWSADGRSIYYAFMADATKTGALHRFDIAARRDTVVYADATATGIRNLAPSPDGEWIAFTPSRGAGPGNTQVLSLRTGAVRELQPAHPYVLLNWMADSRSLITAYARTGRYQDGIEFSRVALDGAPAERIDFGAKAISNLRIDRTGHRVVFTAEPGNKSGGQLWVMENLLRRTP